MFFYWQEVLAVIEMLLVGHFSSKQGFLSVRVSSFGKSETSDTWAKVPIPAQFRPIYINLLQSNKTEISIFLAWNRLPVCSCDPLSDSAPPTCSGASPSETMLWGNCTVPSQVRSPLKSLRCLYFWSRDASSCQQRAQTIFIGMQRASEILRCNQVSITLGHSRWLQRSDLGLHLSLR